MLLSERRDYPGLSTGGGRGSTLYILKSRRPLPKRHEFDRVNSETFFALPLLGAEVRKGDSGRDGQDCQHDPLGRDHRLRGCGKRELGAERQPGVGPVGSACFPP